MALAEVKHGVEWRFWADIFGGCLSFVGVGEGFVAGDCEGRHEGRSQHKTVSTRSWDSGVEHPRKRKTAKYVPKNDKYRKGME